MGVIPYRYYVIYPDDDSSIFGFNSLDGVETAALSRGEGCKIVDTLSKPYQPMLSEVIGGKILISGISGWDTAKDINHDLIEAIKKGSITIVLAFIKKGASANSKDQNDSPALHWAVGGGKIDIIQTLVFAGADIDTKDKNMLTAMDIAVKKNRDDIIAILK